MQDKTSLNPRYTIGAAKLPTISSNFTRASTLELQGLDGKSRIRVHSNGKVELINCSDADEAARIFWSAVERMGLKLTTPEDAPTAVAVPDGWKLVPVQVPDSAFPWVSGGYSTDYRARDPRDQKIIEERAQRTWAAILDGIAAAPAAPAPSQEEAEIGMAWYNSCTEAERAKWHGLAGSAVPVDAYLAFQAAQEASAAFAAPVVLPEPDVNATTAVELALAHGGRRVSAYGKRGDPVLLYPDDLARLLAGVSAPAVQTVPDGWREKFVADVYADLAAADNQDVPLEEYPARILKVLDTIVGPRHPVVIKWRNDAIRSCIAITYKYCRDPESHKYLKQDLEAMLTAEPEPQAPAADALDAARYRWIARQKNVWGVLGEVYNLPCELDGARGLSESIDAAIAAQAAQKGRTA